MTQKLDNLLNITSSHILSILTLELGKKNNNNNPLADPFMGLFRDNETT